MSLEKNDGPLIIVLSISFSYRLQKAQSARVLAIFIHVRIKSSPKNRSLLKVGIFSHNSLRKNVPEICVALLFWI